MHYDVFNGDADGVIALIQLRLADPKESTLVTGVKRDINLLKKVDTEQATTVTVLDVSLEKNIEALEALLAKNVNVHYIDHHRPGDIPDSAHLTTDIDTDANTCTSLIVNQILSGQYVNWAIAAAYGDNMNDSAQQLAHAANLTAEENDFLKNLGIYINYNGYGSDLTDLHFAPDELYRLLVQVEDPLELQRPDSVYHTLQAAYLADMSKAQSASVLHEEQQLMVLALPDEPWSRRISGVYGNLLANQAPERAHAVVTVNHDDSYRVSLRAPLANKQGAGDICAQFPTGGGRAAAAGINELPSASLALFIDTVTKYYQR